MFKNLLVFKNDLVFFVNLLIIFIVFVSFVSLVILVIWNNLVILKKEKIVLKGIIVIRLKIFFLKNLILFFEIKNLIM